MKFYNVLALFAALALTANADEDARRVCPNTAETFEQCINNYGGYQPTETTCASKASLGDEYQRCLAKAYYNLSECFNQCPNHPRKAEFQNFFAQYQNYYVPPTPAEASAAASAAANAANPTPTGKVDLEAGTDDATKLTAFSLSAVLCMIAYFLL